MWDEWAREFLTGVKWTDALIALFLLGQVLVAWRQANISRQQTKIAAETREIAVVALGRPHVFFEFVSHNLEQWRSGEDWMHFVFRFTNHGSSPAIIRAIHARPGLYYDPYYRGKDETKLVDLFPDEETFLGIASQGIWSNVIYASGQGDGKTIRWKAGGTIVLRPGESSRCFETRLPFPPLQFSNHELGWQAMQIIHNLTGDDKPVAPWLMGGIFYESPFRSFHNTTFCVCANKDGGILEYNQRPYNERT